MRELIVAAPTLAEGPDRQLLHLPLFRQPSRRRKNGGAFALDLRQHLRNELAEQRLVTCQIDEYPRCIAFADVDPISCPQWTDQGIQPPHCFCAAWALDRQ